MILYLTLHGMWKIELGNPQNNMGGGGGAPHESSFGKGGLNFFRGGKTPETPLKGWTPNCPGLPKYTIVPVLWV